MLVFDKGKGIIANRKADVIATGNRTTSSNDSGMTLTVVKKISPMPGRKAKFMGPYIK